MNINIWVAVSHACLLSSIVRLSSSRVVPGPYRYDLHPQGEYMFLMAQDSPVYIYHSGLISSGTGSMVLKSVLVWMLNYMSLKLSYQPNPF